MLLVTLKDESDLEVSKTSASVIADLRRILLDYKLNEPVPELPSPKDSAILDTNYVKRSPQLPPNSTSSPSSASSSSPSSSSTSSSSPCSRPDRQPSGSVIEEILEANDANLLASIYRDSMKMDGDEAERTGREMLDYTQKVGREQFLRAIMNYDLEGYIKGRSDWLVNHTSSFDSVMEDILMVGDRKDVNTMDCY